MTSMRNAQPAEAPEMRSDGDSCRELVPGGRQGTATDPLRQEDRCGAPLTVLDAHTAGGTGAYRWETVGCGHGHRYDRLAEVRDDPSSGEWLLEAFRRSVDRYRVGFQAAAGAATAGRR